MAQIQKGDTFVDGQQITGARLNQLIDSAVVLPNIITDQTNLTANTVATGDSILLYDLSATALREATASDLLNSNLPITSSTVTSPVINSTSTLTLTPTGKSSVSGVSYNASSTVVTVTSPSHGLVEGEKITVTSATNSAINNIYHINYIDGSTFSLTLYSSITSGSGTLTYTPNATVIVPAIHSNTSISANSISVLDGDLNVGGNANINSTGALKIPVGTTAQRPSSPVQGQLRYNTTTSTTEVYKGSSWESVGGSPFEATGGNYVIAPDPAGTTPTSASFTSSDGVTVVVTSNGHSVLEGATVTIATAISGYSGDWVVVAKNTNTFTYKMNIAAIPNSGSCTYLKSGNYKIHIFTSSGSFVVGSKTSGVEVLVVGGGAGGGNNSYSSNGGGGGGGVLYCPYFKVTANQTITVVVGDGGAIATNGGSSSFLSLSANGGYTNSGNNGGSSGTTSYTSSNSGGNGYFGYYTGINNQIWIGGGGGGAGGRTYNSGIGFLTNVAGNGVGSSISGVPVEYGGGGAGGCSSRFGSAVQLSNGNGGTAYAPNGIANTGGGGAGAQEGSHSGGTGGSGIVIIKYPYWVS